MIDAEIRGKLGRNYSRAHERAEDVLTSTVFGLFRYVEWGRGLGAFLSCARLVSEGANAADDPLAILSDSGWLPSGVGIHGVAQLWLRTPGYGEPDVFVTVHDGAGQCVAEVIVEAKLWSGKSSLVARGSDEDDVEDDGAGDGGGDCAADDAGASVDADQLVRYWQWLTRRPCRDGQPLPLRAIVYLTAHACPPRDELRDSLGRQPGMRLLWLSWQDAWDVARRCPDSLPATDIARLLVHKGMSRFAGFSRADIPDTLALAQPAQFWRGARWFAAYPCAHDISSFEPRTFWSRR